MSIEHLTSCISLTLMFFIILIIVYDFIDQWVDEYYESLESKVDHYQQYWDNKSITTEYQVIGVTRDFAPAPILRIPEDLKENKIDYTEI